MLLSRLITTDIPHKKFTQTDAESNYKFMKIPRARNGNMRDKANIIPFLAFQFAQPRDLHWSGERIKTRLAFRKYFASTFPASNRGKLRRPRTARSWARESKVCSAIISLLRNLGNRRRSRYPAAQRATGPQVDKSNHHAQCVARSRGVDDARSARLIINRAGAIMPLRIRTYMGELCTYVCMYAALFDFTGHVV